MKILVGINGDAESFLTAVMLKEQGNDVMGGVINCAGANVSSAAASAEKAGITFVTIPGEGVTKAKIASVLCDYARDKGYDAVATGHYCRIVVDEQPGILQEYLDLQLDIQGIRDSVSYR